MTRRDLFRPLDSIEPPDRWAEIEQRTAQAPGTFSSPRHLARTIGLIAASFAVTVGLVAMLVVAFRPARREAHPGDDSATPSAITNCPDVRSTPLVLRDDGFEVACLSAPAGERFDLRLENRDDGIPHNVSLAAVQDCDSFEGGSMVTCPEESVIAQTELQAGSVISIIEILPLQPGEYYFYCIAHPAEFGRLLVT